ncbi:MAG: ATP-binding cassette domain-containing protein, partial [Lentisphaeria bacterium]|nr:ATP-binding cassette domain-containing protein [Lentisphaeria bacterium]
MIQCRDISIAFQGKIVLDRIGLSIPDGAFLCLLGQSGCGKSTLLRIIAGLLKATSGDVLVDGKPVDGPEPACSVVFQDYSLFPWMTTGRNLMLALAASYPRKSKAEIRNL